MEGEQVQTKVTLPQNYPLCTAGMDQLKTDIPLAKVAYYDKIVQPYLDNIKKSVIETINLKLEIAAQRYLSNELSDEKYAETKNSIYESMVNEDWIDGVQDAFNMYSISNDAYSSTLNISLISGSQQINISNLYQYVSEEKDAIKNNRSLPVSSLSKIYEEEVNKLKQKDEENDKNAIAQAIRNFRQIIFVSVYPERPLPFSLEVDDPGSNNDEEIEVDGGKIDLTCPISRELFKKPVKSKICNHTYDLDALKIYLRSSSECPECGNHLMLTDTIPDILMQTRVECFKRDKKLEELIKERRPDETDKL